MKLIRITDEKRIASLFAPLPCSLQIVDGGIKSITIGDPNKPVVVIGKNYYGENIDVSVPQVVTMHRSKAELKGAMAIFQSEFQHENESELDAWESNIKKDMNDDERLKFTRDTVETLA